MAQKRTVAVVRESSSAKAPATRPRSKKSDRRSMISVRTCSRSFALSPPSPAHNPRMSRLPCVVTGQGAVDGPVLPLRHPVEDLVGDGGDRRLRHLGALRVGQVRTDVPVGHPRVPTTTAPRPRSTPAGGAAAPRPRAARPALGPPPRRRPRRRHARLEPLHHGHRDRPNLLAQRASPRSEMRREGAVPEHEATPNLLFGAVLPIVGALLRLGQAGRGARRRPSTSCSFRPMRASPRRRL